MTEISRVAMWQTAAITLLVLMLLVAAAPSPARGAGAPSAQPHAQPVLFGQFAGNVLVGFYYSNPVTSSVVIVGDGSQVPVDTLQVAAANPGGPQNLTFAIEQYVPVTEQRTAPGPDNTTITRPVVVAENIQWQNQTVALASRSVGTYQVQLPQAPRQEVTVITSAGASWTFYHHTSPGALPAFLTQGGELGLAAGVIALSSLDWAFAALTARAVVRRAKYWPQRSLAGWVVILFMVAFTAYGALGAFYYELAYVPWYTWLLPLFYICVAFMLGIFEPRVERWELEHYTGSAREDTLESDVRSILTAPHSELGNIYVHKSSRRAALKRLLGLYTPIRFRNPKVENGKVVRPWSAENRLCEDPIWDVKRTFWIDPEVDPDEVGMKTTTYREARASGEEGNESPRRWLPWRHSSGKRIREFVIPLSGSYTSTIPEFVSGLYNAVTIGEELEKTRWEKEEAEAKLDSKFVDFDAERYGARLAAAGLSRGRRDIDGYKRVAEGIREQARAKLKSDGSAK